MPDDRGDRMSTLPHQASGPLDPDQHAVASAPATRADGRSRSPAAAALPFLLGWLVVILGALLGIGMLLVKFATGNDVEEADDSVSRWFVGERTPTLDQVTHFMSLMADTLVVIGLAALVVVVTRVALKRWREGLLIITALVGEVILFLSTTALVDRERPSVPLLDDAPPTSSFPSGHVAAAICLYGGVAIIAWSRMRPGALRGLVVTLLCLVPVAVAVARLYRGMHHLTDVLAGIAFGSVWLTVAARGVRRGAVQKAARDGAAGTLPTQPRERLR
jgi:membrane-associated phospholipid phosphatase